MNQNQKRLEQIYLDFSASYKRAKVDDGLSRVEALGSQMASDGFWDDPKKAGELSKQHSDLLTKLEPWLNLRQEINDLKELAEIGDVSIEAELTTQIDEIEKSYNSLKKILRYDGPYDDNDAILSIYAGAGGTDAQDWAEMLERMYLRWLEQSGFKASIVDRSTGDEAGIKSVVIAVSGGLAYGKLKNEHGVHRLVRLSPFNSDNLRQTSFAKVEILPKIDRPDDLIIDDKDLKIDVFRAGGHGGQSVNTTDSAVRVTHLPTGVVVSIQNERSQLQNKEMAMTILRSRLTQLRIEHHKEKLADLKGVNQSAEWGNQIRNYVLHPYKLVKDLRTGVETSAVDAVLDGKIDEFIDSLN